MDGIAFHDKFSDSRTSLHIACKKGDLNFVKDAIKYGLNINTIAGKDYGTPLFMAIEYNHFDIIKYIFSLKPNLNLCTKLSRITLIHKGVISNSSDIVEYLLKNGCDIKARDINNRNVIHYAVIYNSINVIPVLLRFHASFNGCDCNLMTPLHLLAQYGSSEIAELLLNQNGIDTELVDKNGMTPLLSACFRGNHKIVKLLVNHKAMVNAKDSNGNNCLHWACVKGSKKCIKYLINAGVKINKPSNSIKKYSTPLQLVARTGEYDAVEYLLNIKCDINQVDCAGNTALHATCIGKNGKVNIDLFVLLIQHGVKYSIKNNEGFTAIEKGQLGRDSSFSVEAFKKIFNCNLPDVQKEALLIEIITHQGFNANNPLLYQDGIGPLSFALNRKYYKLAELLIALGIKYNNREENLPIAIFESNNTTLISFFVDILLSERIINLSNCRLCHLPQILLDRLILYDSNRGNRDKKILDISGNKLNSIPSKLINLQILSTVKIEGNPLLLIPETYRTSWLKIQLYYKNIIKRTKSWAQCKLILVGEEGTGKTTLLKCLKKRKGKSKCKDNISTNGIDVCKGINFKKTKTTSLGSSLNKHISNNESDIIFNVWDFGGQEIFYPTHQFFLSEKSLYIVIFNAADMRRDRIEYWMWQIRTLTNSVNPASVLIVGTHIDCIKETERDIILTERDMAIQFPKQRFPGLRGINFVSCKTGAGIQELKDSLVDIAIKYESIPKIKESWLRMLDIIEEKSVAKITRPYIKWSEFCEWANDCEVENNDLENCIKFLCEAGRIVSMHEFDSSDSGLIIIDPMWLAKLMGNFLTFKHTWVKRGILHENHINQVFIEYPNDIHLTLINMLKKFNILYPLQADVSKKCKFIIPTMLPETLEENDVYTHWVFPFIICSLNTFGRNYLFSFLPHGLISKLIIRLLHIPSVIGLCYAKYAVILAYKGQRAMIEYLPEQYKLVIFVRASEEAISDSLFRWIIDVTDTLLDDSFQMAKAYRKTIPCTHCLKKFGAEAITSDEPFEFTFSECVQAITNKRLSIFCNHIQSASREVRITDLAPDIAFADIHIIKEKDILKGKILAKSDVNQVFEGSIIKTNKKIAIKQQLFQQTSKGMESLFQHFQQEVFIMSKLSHINLVKLLGVTLYPDIQIVLELLPYGDLFAFLHPSNDLNNDIKNNNIQCISKDKFPWKLRITIIKDIANAMLYLQSQNPPIIHRDLRSPNIFLASINADNDTIIAKVADFGLSRFVASGVEGTLNTWEWVAPETLEKSTYSLSADVYSFGIVCWEICSRKYPFDEYYENPEYCVNNIFDPFKIKYSIIHNNLRPSLHLLDNETPNEIKNIINKCWHPNPDKRPTFKTIIQIIDKLYFQYIDKQNIKPLKRSNSIEVLPKIQRTTSNITTLHTISKNKNKNKNNWNNAYVEDYKCVGKLQLLFPATCVTVVNNTIWIGSRNGAIYIANNELTNYITRWKAHEHAISCILYLGSNVWTASFGGCVRVWDVETLQEQQEFHPFRANNTSIKQLLPIFKNNGNIEVWGSSPKQKQIYIWNAESLELIHYLPLPKNIFITVLQQCFIDIDNDSLSIVLAGDIKGEIHMINANTLQYFASWKAHDGPISGIQKCELSIEIWTSCRNNAEIKIWKLENNEMINEATSALHNSGGILLLQPNPASHAICSCSNNTVVCWDTRSQKPIQELEGHKDRIVTLYGHRNIIYSISRDGWILLWQKKDKFVTAGDGISSSRTQLYAQIKEQKEIDSGLAWVPCDKRKTLRRSLSQGNFDPLIKNLTNSDILLKKYTNKKLQIENNNKSEKPKMVLSASCNSNKFLQTKPSHARPKHKKIREIEISRSTRSSSVISSINKSKLPPPPKLQKKQMNRRPAPKRSTTPTNT